jgi:hypothetical protein
MNNVKKRKSNNIDLLKRDYVLVRIVRGIL